MEVDAARRWRYSVIHAGRPTPLEVRVLRDGPETADAAFSTSRDFAEAIRQEMFKFADELGFE